MNRMVNSEELQSHREGYWPVLHKVNFVVDNLQERRKAQEDRMQEVAAVRHMGIEQGNLRGHRKIQEEQMQEVAEGCKIEERHTDFLEVGRNLEERPLRQRLVWRRDPLQ